MTARTTEQKAVPPNAAPQTPTSQTPTSQTPTPQRPQRRRASRAAGPPQDAPKSSSRSNSPSGKVRKPAGTPVKAAPLSRKQKPTSPALVPATPPVSPGKPEIKTESGADTGAQSFGSTSVTRGVSYRDRRRGGRTSDLQKGRVRRLGRSGDKTSAEAGGSPRGRGNLRGLGIAAAAVVSIGLIAGMVAASTFFVMGTNTIDERNALRAEYSAFARQMITNLTTLNPENIDGAITTFQESTSGKAMEQTSQSMEQTVNMIKSENVSTEGTVISDAVLDGGDALPGQEPLMVDGKVVPRKKMDDNWASVIVVSAWEMNQPNVPDQQTVLQTFRWKLDITRINGQLKLTNIEWVT